MAELPELGKHCSVDACKTLDFLPITCGKCNKTLCKNHCALEAHNCASLNEERETISYDGPRSYPCQFSGCEGRELTPIVCEHCSNTYCLKHRHQVDHACVKLEAQQPKMQQTAEHVKNILEAKQGAASVQTKSKGHKSAATAAKVALMKIKMKAVGDKGLPDSERVYLQVFLPKNSKDKNKPLFFSKTWTVGRVIDKSADLCTLVNNNNVGNALKLRLFCLHNGEILPIEKKLDDFLNDKVLFNGSSVVLEYVDINNVNEINTKDYTS